MNDKTKFVLFGGMSTKRMEDVYFLDEEGKWELIETKGWSPRGRCYHQAWYEFPYLYIMGGELEKTQSSDVFCLHTLTNDWKKLFAFESPCPRSMHTIA